MTRGTRALLALVIVMGVLIVLGTTTLVVVVVHRLTHPQPTGETGLLPPSPPGSPLTTQGPLPAVTVLSDEPPGTRITGLTRQSDTRLAIALTGGGPDRILIWDLTAGRTVTEIRLGR